MTSLTTRALFDTEHTLLKEYLLGFEYPWQALTGLREAICALFDTLDGEYEERAEGVFVHRTAEIAKSAYLRGPCIVGQGSEVRHGAFVRGSALIGEGCVVGNSVELKNAVLFDNVQVPHFNYVGDSILGYRAHMGAGAVTSNVKCDRTPVSVKAGDEQIFTGLKKFGAMLGDFVEIGCNSVLNPGCVVGRGTHVYPLSSLRGAYPENCIVKGGGIIVPRR